ncbi:MAG: hypothetical protein HSCHL_2474 [Hydrogenibacillus schlegelii]|uniref:Extradiol ring-cleavage dioxygenase class III enzyme subunit B domain-containing protein n=1 Tax=Hydrogenibacillus schlegelii TaxID=1484 RepID=A0A2T5G3V6_HYDSH|nr:class III extradiol ring-cleavage dioxygenase [Hydrogenibacillus schlegelii]PTQ50867.1 MAG: hypothetical protein HSCHL_2474 [Hydrogenibacillus schlegelii]
MIAPALFIAHGSPMLAIEDDAYAAFLTRLGASWRDAAQKPRAVVVFTAHWTTRHPTVSMTDGPYETIHDFYGFPEALYEVTYPARGSKAVAERVRTSLAAAGFSVSVDPARGLDHGAWVVLRRLFPAADVPVVQASVVPGYAPEQLFRIGEALRPLRREGVLLIGSGGTVHNLMSLRWTEAEEAEAWAVDFDDWLLEKTIRRDVAALFDYRRAAPHALRAVPTPEHLAPYWIALGAGLPDQTPEVLYRDYQYGSLSLLAVAF